jgi:hypothetical protein
MPINGMTFATALLAENASGVSAQRALPLALFASTLRSPMTGVILALAATRLGRPSTSQTFNVAISPATKVNQGGWLVPGSGTALTPMDSSAIASLDIGTPSFINMTRHHAEKLAEALGLVPIFENDTGDEAHFVVKQTPTVGGNPRKSKTVTLELGSSKLD